MSEKQIKYDFRTLLMYVYFIVNVNTNCQQSNEKCKILEVPAAFIFQQKYSFFLGT